MRDPFLKDAAECLAEIDRREPPFEGSLRALDRISRQVQQARHDAVLPASALVTRKNLLQLFALAFRAARDLGVETIPEAIDKDIPF